jgi:antirestriction protein ArdC
LAVRDLVWDRMLADELAGFKPWLRPLARARRGKVAVLPAVESTGTESTIDRKLAAEATPHAARQRRSAEPLVRWSSASRS